MDEEELLRRLKLISQIEPISESVERARKRVRQVLMEELERQEDLRSKTRMSITRKRIIKLAAVAVVIVAALVGVHWFSVVSNGAGVAWAEVVENVERVQTFIYRLRQSETVVGEEEIRELETVVYTSSEHGIRMDNYRNEQVVYSTFTLPRLRLMVGIIHTKKMYTHQPLSEKGFRAMIQMEPKEVIKRYILADYEELGREIIDGVKVEAIEVTDPNVVYGTTHPVESFVGRLWVDVETDFPVLLEREVVFKDGATQNVVIDEFEWDAELDAGDFEPDIPADYTLMKEESGELEPIGQEEETSALAAGETE